MGRKRLIAHWHVLTRGQQQLLGALVFCLGLAGGVAILSARGCVDLGSRDFSISTVERIMLRMESHYIRGWEKNSFSLHYGVLPPDTLLFRVQYTKDTDHRVMTRTIESAKELARGIARNDFGIEAIPIKVDMKEIERANPPEPQN